MNISQINENNVVTLDFETYYGDKYSLTAKDMNTSEYIRDERFKVHMVGIKVGNQPTRVYLEHEVAAALAAIDWTTHALLCQNTAFDGLILSHHYGIVPALYLDTLSMSRALHGPATKHNLDTIAKRYGFAGKVRQKALSNTKNIRDLSERPDLIASLSEYCADDVNDTHGIFWKMYEGMSDDELELIDITIRAFCDPVLLVDTPRVEAELEKEIAGKVAALLISGVDKERLLSAEKFADELRKLGVTPPMKISKATGQPTYAFASTDRGFIALGTHADPRVVNLHKARLLVKSTIGETRAGRFLEAGRDGMKLPVALNYCGAHTYRWCMPGNSEVLTPEGWKRMDSFKEGTIMQWSTVGKLSWCPYTRINKFPFAGNLITANNSHIVGAYTQEHTIPTITTKGEFKKHTAESASGLNVNVPINGTLDTKGFNLTDSQIKLLVAVQADGTIEDPLSRPIRFKFRKTRKMDRLRDICTEAKIELQEFKTPPETAFSIPRKAVPSFLWSAKQFDYSLLGLSQAQRLVFLEELRYWDGSISSNVTHYTTTNKQNAEVVCTLAHVSGLAANLHCTERAQPQNNKYTVTIRNATKARIQSAQWGSTTHTGHVYCPTTETGYFLVRSEGKIYVTGNSGGNKMNLQNLVRGGELRRSLLAPPGSVIVVADSAQIEARINAWLSDELGLLEAFRQYDAGTGPDVYKVTASGIFGVPVDQVTSFQRQVGKVVFLAAGFGIGTDRLKDTLELGLMGAPIVLGDFEEYEKAKWGYRNKYRNIVNMWDTAKRLLFKMTVAQGAQSAGEYKCLKFGKDWVRLPNGMFLRYPNLRTDQNGGLEFDVLHGPTRIYGGLFVENLVQALARVVIADQMLSINRLGYRIVTMTHDEIVVVCPEDKAEQCKADMLRIMSTPPTWAPTLPLSAEAGYDTCYSK